MLEKWVSMLRPWVKAAPSASRPEALRLVRDQIVDTLDALGFDVDLMGAGVAPVVVARRPGVGCHTLGLAGHYDVEEVGDGWTVPASTITERDGRLYGRGLADNLGPLALRLTAIELRQAPTPPLLWVIQGEEEIGSPLAHQVYPTLDVSDVSLWLEETGYFEADGSQRLLEMDLDSWAVGVRDAAIGALQERLAQTHPRYLNKAFGQQHCPFLAHLASGRPYLAIGPNDPESSIHAADESLPLSTLDVSVRQFDAVLTAAMA